MLPDGGDFITKIQNLLESGKVNEVSFFAGVVSYSLSSANDVLALRI